MNFKLAIVAFFGYIPTIFAAFYKGWQSAKNKIKAESEETAREYERAGSETLIGGLNREQENVNEDIDTDKRDHFSK